MRLPTRREILAWGGAIASGGLLPLVHAQDPALSHVRIGTVFPAKSGETSLLQVAVNDVIGEGARMGAVLADAVLGQDIAQQGMRLDVLLASSPSAEAARRAGERLIEAQGVCALVGGVGAGQAAVLSEIAETAGIPFLNVGSSEDTLRQGACGRYTFHIEASAAMYLDAMTAWAASGSPRRWFLVYEDSEQGRRLHQRAVAAVAKQAAGEVVGAAAVMLGQLVFFTEIARAQEAQADVILLLVDEIEQLPFLGQMQDARVDIPTLAFPTTISQTRDYVAAARYVAPATGPRFRAALWETTMEENGAGDFNERFISRWGQPADSTAWASYSAIKILLQAIRSTGTLDGSALVEYLERPDSVFDVFKGAGVSFRSWDHQLRQPLYMIEVDQEIEYWEEVLSSRTGLARLAGEFPRIDANDADPVARLDRLGDDASATACRL